MKQNGTGQMDSGNIRIKRIVRAEKPGMFFIEMVILFAMFVGVYLLAKTFSWSPGVFDISLIVVSFFILLVSAILTKEPLNRVFRKAFSGSVGIWSFVLLLLAINDLFLHIQYASDILTFGLVVLLVYKVIHTIAARKKATAEWEFPEGVFFTQQMVEAMRSIGLDVVNEKTLLFHQGTKLESMQKKGTDELIGYLWQDRGVWFWYSLENKGVDLWSHASANPSRSTN